MVGQQGPLPSQSYVHCDVASMLSPSRKLPIEVFGGLGAPRKVPEVVKALGAPRGAFAYDQRFGTTLVAVRDGNADPAYAVRAPDGKTRRLTLKRAQSQCTGVGTEFIDLPLCMIGADMKTMYVSFPTKHLWRSGTQAYEGTFRWTPAQNTLTYVGLGTPLAVVGVNRKLALLRSEYDGQIRRSVVGIEVGPGRMKEARLPQSLKGVAVTEVRAVITGSGVGILGNAGTQSVLAHCSESGAASLRVW